MLTPSVVRRYLGRKSVLASSLLNQTNITAGMQGRPAGTTSNRGSCARDMVNFDDHAGTQGNENGLKLSAYFAPFAGNNALSQGCTIE
jgi:hypothetical protein